MKGNIFGLLSGRRVAGGAVIAIAGEALTTAPNLAGKSITNTCNCFKDDKIYKHDNADIGAAVISLQP